MGSILIVGSSAGGFAPRSPNVVFGMDGESTGGVGDGTGATGDGVVTGAWMGAGEAGGVGSPVPTKMSPKLDF